MRMTRLVMPALALLFAWPSAVAAQEEQRSWDEIMETFERGCGDDDGNDRCDSEVQQRMHGLYRIDGPAELLEQGVTMRRAMFVDGYGNDVAAITFARRPGEAPMVEVKAPRREGAPEFQPLVAAIGRATWETVLARSRNFDQSLARELPSERKDGAFPNLCLHAWFVVAEAVDASRVSQNVVFGSGSIDAARDPALPVNTYADPGKIRVDAESACADGLAAEYAFELADIALAALPECGTLDLANFRGAAEMLGQCHALRGDRLAAGEATGVIHKLSRAMRLEQGQELQWLFVGTGEARANLFKAAIDGGTLYFSAVHGIDADHALIEGEVAYMAEDSGQLTETADLKLRLLRQTGEFVIDTFEVTNRRPFTPEK
jgi:hypothetical protein